MKQRTYQKGERWRLKDGREVIIVWQMPNRYLRVLNENGKIENITEGWLLLRLDNDPQVPSRKNRS